MSMCNFLVFELLRTELYIIKGNTTSLVLLFAYSFDT